MGIKTGLALPSDIDIQDYRFLEILNERLNRISELLAKAGGVAGTAFDGDIDMRGHRILNLSGTQDGLDAMNRAEADGRYGSISRTVVQQIIATSGGGGGGGGTGTALVLDVALDHTTPTAISSPATPTEGQLLIVWLFQDATGGCVFTWHADYQDGPPHMDPLPNAYAAIAFCGKSDAKWWRVS